MNPRPAPVPPPPGRIRRVTARVVPPAPPAEPPTKTTTTTITSRLDPAIETLLIALLVFGPAAFGAVEAWSNGVMFALGAAISVLLAARAWTTRAPLRLAPAWLPIVAFILIALLQLLPLPRGVVETVSPRSAELRAELLDDLPDAKRALSSMTLSFYPPATRDDLRTVVLAVIVFAAVVSVYRDPRRVRRLLLAVTLIGAAAAGLALAQDVTGTNAIYWRVEMNEPARSGTFANHSHYAQFMNLSIGSALALLLAQLARTDTNAPGHAREAGRGVRADANAPQQPPAVSPGPRAQPAWAHGNAPSRSITGRIARALLPGAVVVAGIATILLSLSRGGMVAIVAAGTVTLFALLAHRRLRWLGGVVVLLGACAGAVLLTYGYDRVEQRIRQGGGLEGRILMARDALTMARDFPLSGAGLGTFQWAGPMYDTTGAPATATHAENEYAQALAETGFIGLAAVLAFVAVVGVHWLRAARSDDPLRASAAVGLGYGLVAVMVHSLSDFGQHLPANACLSAVTCGLLINLGRRERARTPAFAGESDTTPGDAAPPERERSKSRAAFAVACVVALSLTGWLLVDATRTWRAERHWRVATRLADDLSDDGWDGSPAEYDALLSAARAAIALQPDSAYYRYWVALYRWRQSRYATEPDEATTIADAREVVAQLHHARRLCPTFGPIYSVLGQIEHAYLGLPIGLTHVQTATRLAPNDGTIAFTAARADARRGKWQSAQEKFRRSIRLDTSKMDEAIAFYLEELNRPDLLIEMADFNWYHMMQVSAALWKNEKYRDLAWRANAKAADLLEIEIQTTPTAWNLATLASYRANLGDHAAAEKAYARALEQEPTNLHWRVQRGDALRALNRFPEALEEARTALRQHPDAPEAKRLMAELTK